MIPYGKAKLALVALVFLLLATIPPFALAKDDMMRHVTIKNCCKRDHIEIHFRSDNGRWKVNLAPSDSWTTPRKVYEVLSIEVWVLFRNNPDIHKMKCHRVFRHYNPYKGGEKIFINGNNNPFWCEPGNECVNK